jgi:hypothetical protein
MDLSVRRGLPGALLTLGAGHPGEEDIGGLVLVSDIGLSRADRISSHALLKNSPSLTLPLAVLQMARVSQRQCLWAQP